MTRPNRRTWVLLTIFAALALIFLTSCASTAGGKLQQATISYRTALEAINVGHDVGFISDDQLVRAKPFIVGGKNALDRAHAQFADGAVDDLFWRLLDIADAATISLDTMFKDEVDR